ncbi:MAG TPA: hypothetical protein VKB38_01545 [Terracidiphilus sp.]|nr:hypothetical protein [Terracidiphilus sp.]
MVDRSSRRLGRSFLALFAGFLVVLVLSLTADILLYRFGVSPAPGQRMPDRLLLVALAYRTVFAVLGSYLTARLAPYGPMLHAMTGGVIGFCIGMAGVLGTWNSPQAAGAHWYPILVAVVALPAAWIGGSLYRNPAAATTA